jgi:hypothetical protein
VSAELKYRAFWMNFVHVLFFHFTLKNGAIQLVTKTCRLIVLSLYRAPSGDFNQFINKLGAAYNPKYEFLFCSDKYKLLSR